MFIGSDDRSAAEYILHRAIEPITRTGSAGGALFKPHPCPPVSELMSGPLLTCADSDLLWQSATMYGRQVCPACA